MYPYPIYTASQTTVTDRTKKPPTPRFSSRVPWKTKTLELFSLLPALSFPPCGRRGCFWCRGPRAWYTSPSIIVIPTSGQSAEWPWRAYISASIAKASTRHAPEHAAHLVLDEGRDARHGLVRASAASRGPPGSVWCQKVIGDGLDV